MFAINMRYAFVRELVTWRYPKSSNRIAMAAALAYRLARTMRWCWRQYILETEPIYMSEHEYHVSSYVVRVRPEDGQSVSKVIAAIEGLEVHVEENGKLIVTAEAGNVRELADLSTVLTETEKVVSVAPIYHEFSSDEESTTPASQDEQQSTRVKLQ
jgi:nitrate reductase NapD